MLCTVNVQLTVGNVGLVGYTVGMKNYTEVRRYFVQLHYNTSD